MMKLLWLVVLASVACRLIAGRWPWQLLQARNSERARIERARRLLGLPQHASRQEVIDAHRRLVATVHPDRGGSSTLVHEANDARDLLLADLDSRSINQ
jgi:DnaJ family protein C protein 19